MELVTDAVNKTNIEGSKFQELTFIVLKYEKKERNNYLCSNQHSDCEYICVYLYYINNNIINISFLNRIFVDANA